MRQYSKLDFMFDVAVLGLGAEFDADDIQAMWKARARKAGFADDQERLQGLNVARDRLIDWLAAGRPAFDGEDDPAPQAATDAQTVMRWPPAFSFELTMPTVLAECQAVFGVPVPLLFAAWGLFLFTGFGLVIHAEAIFTFLLAVLMAPFIIVFGIAYQIWLLIADYVSAHLPNILVMAVIARVAFRVHRYIERDVRQVCPKCKKPGVLQMVSDEFINSRWHSHNSTVGHGQNQRREIRYDTTENWRATYRCDDCGHQFVFNYPKFYMNSPSVEDPMHLMMGLLRMALGV